MCLQIEKYTDIIVAADMAAIASVDGVAGVVDIVVV